MNHAVTFGVKMENGQKKFTVILDPNVSHSEQRKQFRKLRHQLHGEYDEVQLWTSSLGRVKRQPTRAEKAPESVAAPTLPVAETGKPDIPEDQAGSPDVPDKRAANLAKARAAAKAKKAAAENLLG